MAHISINIENMPIEIVENTEINPLISKCQIKVCYVGDEPNRNNSIITKNVAQEIAKTLPGCPIVGYYNDTTEDFEEHNKIIDLSNGKFQIKDTTKPYGFVPTNAKVWFQWFEDDGVAHEYLMTEGYIWTGQYPESQRVIENGNNQSMELDTNTLDAYWTKDINGKPKFFIINEAIISKLCILGEEYEPCFEGASISNVQFSLEDDFKQAIFSMMEKIQEILDKDEGGTPVLNTYAVDIGCSLWDAIYEYMYSQEWYEYSIDSIYEENNQKFVILRNRTDLKYYRLNFSITEDQGFKAEGELIAVSPEFKPLDTPQFAPELIEAYELKLKESKEENKESAPTMESETTVDFSAEPETEVQPEVEPVVDPEPVVESEPAVELEPVIELESVVEEGQEQDFELEMEPKVAIEIGEVEKTVDEEEKNKYSLEEVIEYQELLKEYAKLEEKINELNSTIENYSEQLNTANSTIENLNSELNSFKEFKMKIDREKKQELIDSFYMLSDDLKKDCVNNIDTYSLDDIEAKLSVICVRNRVSFDIDKPEEKEAVVFNLNESDNAMDDILPAWIQRVQEVAKEKNI